MLSRHRTTFAATGLAVAVLLGGGCASADGPGGTAAPGGHFNVPMPTLGGKQLWSDEFIYAGWRIQQNVVTEHHRLLDSGDVRRAWGSFAHCREVFDQARKDKPLTVGSRHLVVMLHGLGRSKDIFDALAAVLRHNGYEPASVNYPSTRRNLAAHADQLNRLLEAWEDVATVSFVTHSLGGVVIRAALARAAPWRERVAVNAVVLVAPPSQGSAMADALHDVPLVDWLAGESLDELTTDQITAVPPLAVPFGIVAGGRQDGYGYSPILAGDDDGVVSVAETHLPGALDWLVVDSMHTYIVSHPITMAAVVEFLREHRFDRARQMELPQRSEPTWDH